MIKLLLALWIPCLLTVSSCRRQFPTLKHFLIDSIEPDHTYVLVFTSLQLQKEGGAHMNRLPYEPPQGVERIDFFGTKLLGQVGITPENELPQIRIIRNQGEVYEPQLEKLDFTFEWYPDQIQHIVENEHLQRFDRKLNFPLHQDLINFQHLYIKAAYYMAGMPIQQDRRVTVGVLALMGATIGCLLYAVAIILKKQWDKPLTTQHAVKLLGFWAMLDLLFLPNIHLDFSFHHQWKIVTNTLPISRWYHDRPYQLDYPPLFAYLEWLQGSILGIFFPDDLKPDSLHRESVGFRVAMGVLNVIVNSSFWFALLRAVRILEVVWRKRVTVSLFALVFLNSALIFSDGARNQANQMILALILLSISYMLEHRYLMSAFCYCVALNSKQIAVYFSLAYFLYLLIVYGLTPSFNFKNLFKLGSLVIGFHALVYLPFASSLQEMLTNMSGVNEHNFAILPNLQNLYTFLELVLELKYTRSYRIPLAGKVVIMGAFGAMLGRLIYSRRQQAKYFPLYAFISGFAFFNILDIVHFKHLVYFETPLLLYWGMQGGEYLRAAAGLKTLNIFLVLTRCGLYERLSMKHPLLIFSLWQLKQFDPLVYKFFLFEYLTSEALQDVFVYFNGFRWFWSTVIGVLLFVGYFRVTKMVFREEKTLKEA